MCVCVCYSLNGFKVCFFHSIFLHAFNFLLYYHTDFLFAIFLRIFYFNCMCQLNVGNFFIIFSNPSMTIASTLYFIFVHLINTLFLLFLLLEVHTLLFYILFLPLLYQLYWIIYVFSILNKKM